MQFFDFSAVSPEDEAAAAEDWEAVRARLNAHADARRERRRGLYSQKHAAQACITLSSGHKMPLVGYGTWAKPQGTGKPQPSGVQQAVETALMAGYRHIDCAAYYKNEDEVGAAILECMRDQVVKRDELFVVSKLWNDDHGYDRVRPAVFKSMKALNVTYLDLFLIHWPVTGNSGDEVSPKLIDTWRGLEDCVREGLIKSIGVANFSAKKLEGLLAECTIRPAVNQIEAHPFWRNDRLIEWCAQRGIHVTAYSPLGSPDSESMLRRAPGPKLLEDPTVKAVAERVGKSPGQVLIRWALQHGTSVLPKSVSEARIAQNLDVHSWEIPEQDYKALCGLGTQTKMVDGSFFLSPAGPFRTLDDLWDTSYLEDGAPEALNYGSMYAPVVGASATLSSGHAMPMVGYGTWRKETGSRKGELVRPVTHAIRSGYRHIDCAAYYKNEDEVGDAIAMILQEGVVSRNDLFVTSKLWNSEHGAKKVRPALLKCLKDLKLDYLDLFLIHWPVTGRPGKQADPPLSETWAAMERLVDEGLVRSIGVSNFSAKKLEGLLAECTIRPAVNQIEAHPFWRNDRLIEWCAQRGIHVTAYSPLGSPDSESMLRRAPGPKLLEDPTVKAVAERVGKSPGQVLIRWALQHGTSVLPKSVSEARIAQNLDVHSWEIPEQDYKALCGLGTQTKMVDGSFFLSRGGPYKTLDDLWDTSYLE